MSRRRRREAFVGEKGNQNVSVDTLKRVLEEAISLVKSYNDRFIVPDDFLPDHPDREAMVTYLKALSWRGTTSGAAMSARVPPSKVREWRTLQEFVDWEEFANEACTDLTEEVLIFRGRSTGDRQMLERVLKGRRAEKYSDRQEITGPQGGAIPFEIRLDGVPRPNRIE